MLAFVCLTDLRNPVRINLFKNGILEIGKQLIALDPNIDLKKIIPTITHDEAVKMSMSVIPEIVEEILDLDFKILKYTTKQSSYLYDKDVDEIEEIKKGKKNLIVIGSIDVETKLQIGQIKIHSKGQYKKINSSAVKLRKHCKKRIMEKRNYR